jgi:hypothetical protein
LVSKSRACRQLFWIATLIRRKIRPLLAGLIAKPENPTDKCPGAEHRREDAEHAVASAAPGASPGGASYKSFDFQQRHLGADGRSVLSKVKWSYVLIDKNR